MGATNLTNLVQLVVSGPKHAKDAPISVKFCVEQYTIGSQLHAKYAKFPSHL